MRGLVSMKAMITLRDALAIRTRSSTAVERSRYSGVAGGAEFACWQVTGRGWRARVTNKWDLKRAMAATSGPDAPPSKTRRATSAWNCSSITSTRTCLCWRSNTGSRADEEKLARYRGGRGDRLFEVGTFKPLVADLANAVWCRCYRQNSAARR